MFGTPLRPRIQVSILRHKRTSQFNIADSFEGKVSQIRCDVTPSALRIEPALCKSNSLVLFSVRNLTSP